MDEKIRLLIRKYQKTRDPLDAIKLAENLLRVNEPVEVWVCDIFEGSDNGSDIYLFLTEAEATIKAADWLLKMFKRDYNISGPTTASRYYRELLKAKKSNNAQELSRLVDEINRGLLNRRAGFPPYTVHIFSQEL